MSELETAIIVAAPIVGAAVGWWLNERSSQSRWERERTARWEERRREAYVEFIAAGLQAVRATEPASAKAAVEAVTDAYALVRVYAPTDVAEVAVGIRKEALRKAEAIAQGSPGEEWTEGPVLAPFINAIQVDLGLAPKLSSNED